MVKSIKKEIYTETYKNYFSLIFSIVYSKVNSFEESEDICQEVFLRLYKNYESVENHRKWIFGTMKYVILEHYRKKNKHKTEQNVDLDDLTVTYANGFRDTRLIIEEALEALETDNDKTSRILFELIAINNFTYKETGKQLGLTENQVRYKYGIISDRILHYLERKGIKNLEDLL